MWLLRLPTHFALLTLLSSLFSTNKASLVSVSLFPVTSTSRPAAPVQVRFTVPVQEEQAWGQNTINQIGQCVDLNHTKLEIMTLHLR